MINAQMIFVLSVFVLCLPLCVTVIHEVNEAVFLDPRTHSAIIRCPLEFTTSADIQWYDVVNHRYEIERGHFYRINGSQAVDREFICSSLSETSTDKNDKYRLKIRTYGKNHLSIEQKVNYLSFCSL